MKRIAVVLLAMTISSATAVAQNKPADSKAQPAAPAQAQPAQAQPAPTGGAPKSPQAKTKEEFAAYKTADALTDPAALETSATEFAAKYPESELRGVLYRKNMTLYQMANANDKAVELGRKALALDPNEPVTLITVSSILAERTRETDLDKDERLADATQMAQHGLDSIAGMAMPPGVTADAFKNAQDELRSIGYSALATAAYTKKDYVSAEVQFKKAIDAFKLQPDPSQYLRLTLTLDKQSKYPEALEWANKTLQIAQAGSPFAQFAQQEKDRLTKLTATAPKTATPATATTPATTPK